MKDNYFMLDGRKVAMSEETAESLRENTNLSVMTKFPTKKDEEFYIDRKWAGRMYANEHDGHKYKGSKLAGHGASIYLTSCEGSWFDEKGNNISNNFLFYKPDK